MPSDLKRIKVDCSDFFANSQHSIVATAWVDEFTGLCVVKEPEPLPIVLHERFSVGSDLVKHYRYFPFYICMLLGGDSGGVPLVCSAPRSLIEETGLCYRQGFYTLQEAKYYLHACIAVHGRWCAFQSGALRRYKF